MERHKNLVHKKEVHDDENKPKEFDNTVEGEALLGLGDVKEVHGLNNSVVKSGNKVDLLDRTRSFPCEVCGQKFKLKRNLVSRPEGSPSNTHRSEAVYM